MSSTKTHQPRKRFGQNFLVNEAIIQQIVAAIRPQEKHTLVEIGPGQGAITQWLIQTCPSMTMVELDRDLVPQLQEKFADYPDKTIIQHDALKFDFASLAAGKHTLRIVGNLPYNISTPLMFKLLQDYSLIDDMHFMLQKEVVQRLVAKSGDRHYGRLGIMAQYYCDAELLFDVPPESFFPIPKVDSAIVRLTPHRQIPYVADNLPLLENVVKTAFQQRRKTLRNALKTLVSAEIWEHVQLSPSARPENLNLADYVKLANALHDSNT